jgi:dihydroflavonol-4-reductase
MAGLKEPIPMILVTGGTGFLGRHVVLGLLARGDKVRVLARRHDATLAKAGADVMRGDVTDPLALEPAFQGVKSVLHLAGKVDRSPGAADELYQVHVEGTRNVVAACEKARVKRLVHVSTSGTTAVSDTAEPIADERADYAIPVVRAWPYYLSKIYAEKLVLEAHAAGKVQAVVVSPSLILGPGDEGLSSSREIVRFLRREVPAIPPGGVNFVDVRDAAAAVLAALDKGRPGERYLVGGTNMSLEAFFVLLEKVSGVAAPTLALSATTQALASRALGGLETAFAIGGDEATALAMGGKFWYLDAAKARHELGFLARPAEQTLRDTVESIRAAGPLPAQEGVLGRAFRGFNSLLGVRG